jgi:glycerol uptake facilitator protein
MAFAGLTGYAINPTRDLIPRIMFAILPIKNKGTCDWAYCWVPIVGPIVGAFLAGKVYTGFILPALTAVGAN